MLTISAITGARSFGIFAVTPWLSSMLQPIPRLDAVDPRRSDPISQPLRHLKHVDKVHLMEAHGLLPVLHQIFGTAAIDITRRTSRLQGVTSPQGESVGI
jgi:hypothetical protein